MRYIYIISLALSSIFTYKSIYANETYPLYAFFVPDNAFQQNTMVDKIENMRPRYSSSNQNYAKYDNEDDDIYDDEDIDLEEEDNKEEKNDISSNKLPPITLPYVRKSFVLKDDTSPTSATDKEKPKKVKPIPRPQAPTRQIVAPKIETPPVADEDIKEKLKKYDLTSSFDDSPSDNRYTDSKLESFKKKSIPEMLATIPYPNPRLPKFKQTYASYGMDLRVLYRRGNFPENFEQEKILKKADSMTRFEVK